MDDKRKSLPPTAPHSPEQLSTSPKRPPPPQLPPTLLAPPVTPLLSRARLSVASVSGTKNDLICGFITPVTPTPTPLITPVTLPSAGYTAVPPPYPLYPAPKKVDAELKGTVCALQKQNVGIVIRQESEIIRIAKENNKRKLPADYGGKGKGKENKSRSVLTPPPMVNGISRYVIAAHARKLNKCNPRQSAQRSRREQEKLTKLSKARLFPGLSENNVVSMKSKFTMNLQPIPFSIDLLSTKIGPPTNNAMSCDQFSGDIIESQPNSTFATLSQHDIDFVQSLPDNIMLLQTPAHVDQHNNSSLDVLCHTKSQNLPTCAQSMPNLPHTVQDNIISGSINSSISRYDRPNPISECRIDDPSALPETVIINNEPSPMLYPCRHSIFIRVGAQWPGYVDIETSTFCRLMLRMLKEKGISR
ncbi:hypothetical protein LguiA_036410 [Lonicera macranthoides]